MTSDTAERAARRAAREEEERRSDEADAARRTEKELRLREARRNRPTTYIASWVASTDFRNDISFGLNPGHRGNWDSLCDHGMGPREDFVQFGSWPRGAVCRDHGERTIERLKEAALTRTHAFHASGYAPKGGGEWQLVGRRPLASLGLRADRAALGRTGPRRRRAPDRDRARGRRMTRSFDVAVVGGGVVGCAIAGESTRTQVLDDGSRIEWNLRVPHDRPLDPATPYAQRVATARARGLTYPYEIVRLFTAPPERGSVGIFHPTGAGRFKEHELVDGKPVAYPPGGLPGGLQYQSVLSLRIDREVPLAEAADAHRALEERRTTGKVLLVP